MNNLTAAQMNYLIQEGLTDKVHEWRLERIYKTLTPEQKELISVARVLGYNPSRLCKLADRSKKLDDSNLKMAIRAMKSNPNYTPRLRAIERRQRLSGTEADD